MPIRTVLVASCLTLAVLAAAGCSSAIAGSPVAAVPVASPSSGSAGAVSPGTDGLQIPLPPATTNSDDGPAPSAEDPGTADADEFGGELGDSGSAGPDLGDLLSSLGGQDLDQGSLGDLLGNLGGSGAGISPECLSIAGASMTVGMLMLAPAMGQPLTQAQVDSAFKSLSDMPAELTDAVATLKAAADKTVGLAPAQATAVMSSPEVTAALDAISHYLDAHCAGQ